MDDKGLQRLRAIEKLNADPHWVNQDIYRLMYRPDLYVVAYERLKSNPGNMTPGIDGSTLDGFSNITVQNIIDAMRTGSFQFSPSRRVSIPKPKGGKRDLGIAPPRDKIVQEVMRMILESIYDSQNSPLFLCSSHGFRQGKGTHTALREIRSWHNTKWFIEGDIKGCFDNIDHHVLVGILREKIQDERFLDLVWKALRAGYMQFRKSKLEVSLTGTPQGSILSPILANVYLHKLDTFVEDVIRKKYDTSGNVKRRRNPEYHNLVRLIERRKKRPEPDWKEIKKLQKTLLSLPSNDPNDPRFVRIRYIRYAADWIIGLEGSHSLAKEIKEEVAKFLRDKLSLTLSLEKTFVRHAETEQALFLGTLLSKGTQKNPRVIRISRGGQSFLKRTTGWTLVMKIPTDRVVEKLAAAGFCDREGNPTHRTQWINLDPFDILDGYNAVLHGIANYYSFVNNRDSVGRIQYILHHSCAKTLANKLRLGTRKRVFARFGRSLNFRETFDGKVVSKSFRLIDTFSPDPMNFLINSNPTDRIRMYNSKLTRSRLGRSCAICASIENVEMHHVRHIRKRGVNLKGFNLQMSLINRKQVPLCRDHHVQVHSGKLDNFNLRKSAA